VQALPTQGLVLNRRHPDALGCFFAVPVMERGGEVLRDVARGGSKGLGQPVWTGTRSYGNLRRGRAVSINGVSNVVATPVAGTPWSKNWSCVATINASANAGPDGFIRCGGFVLSVQANVLRVFTEAGGVVATGTMTISLNTEYAVGARWRDSDNLVTFFVNGAKQDIAGTAIATSSVTTKIGWNSPGTGLVGLVKDVRIWDRYMPDATFERYYYDPNSFYARMRAVQVAVLVGAFGRMFPMLRLATRH